MIRRALIFAAGKGERMRPLTERTPKPLLHVGGKRLIEWHLDKLAAFGVHEVIINTSWLAEQFPDVLGDGSDWNLRLTYSHEGPEPLETGGGMLHALPKLGDTPFLVVNGDIWTDFDFAALPLEPRGVGHLVLVPNPTHHPLGDFVLAANGDLHERGYPTHTYAGMGVFRPTILADWITILGDLQGKSLDPPRFPLAPLLFAATRRGALTGQMHTGAWSDVGTPQRLAELDSLLSN